MPCIFLLLTVLETTTELFLYAFCEKRAFHCWGGVPFTSPKLFLEHTTVIPILRWFRLLWSCQQVTRSVPSHEFEITVKSLRVMGPMAAGYAEVGVHIPYQTWWTEVEKTIHPLHYTLIQVCYITNSYRKHIYSESLCALRNRVLSVVQLQLFKDKLTTKLLWQPSIQTLQTIRGLEFSFKYKRTF